MTVLDSAEYGQVAAQDREARLASQELATWTQRPVAVYLVADVSGSMRGGKLAAAKSGMAAFLGQLREERGDAVGLIIFSDKAVEIVPIGRAADLVDLIEHRVLELESGGKTALLDAVQLACKRLVGWTHYIKAVVVLTDGHENASGISTVESVLSAVSRGDGGPALFGLGYGPDADHRFLAMLAEKSGGSSFEGSASNIARVFSRILHLL